jgi:hypothetical protein
MRMRGGRSRLRSNFPAGPAERRPACLLLTAIAPTAPKSGPKLHKAEPGGNTSMQSENGAFVYHGMSMPQFAGDLSTLNPADRPVLSRTGAALTSRGGLQLKIADLTNELAVSIVNGVIRTSRT